MTDMDELRRKIGAQTMQMMDLTNEEFVDLSKDFDDRGLDRHEAGSVVGGMVGGLLAS